MAPINGTGYGQTGLNFLKELVGKGSRVSLFPHATPVCEQVDHNLVWQAQLEAEQFSYQAPCLQIWHQDKLQTRIGRGHYAAMPIFELDRFTDIERHSLNYPDHLFVCSNWARKIILDNGLRDENSVSVVPLGVDNILYSPSVRSINTSDDCIFLNVGKWEIRKGHDMLIEAFLETFHPDDNVQLWMMTHNPFLNPYQTLQWENMYLENDLGRAGKIKIIPWQHNTQDKINFMRQATCGVFPSRAEGWNLGLLEMLALGKHVIATNYSAHTEFCTDENAHLVDINDVEPAYDGIWFHEQGNWAELGESQIVQFKTHLRSVYETHQKGDLNRNEAGIATATQFSWANGVERLEKFYETLD